MRDEKTLPKIKTTGDLRQFLATMMLGVKNGDIDVDKASRITKMAGQINESFYAEVKVARAMSDAGAQIQALGSLALSNTEL